MPRRLPIVAGLYLCGSLLVARPLSRAQTLSTSHGFGQDLCPAGCSMADQDSDGTPDDYDACPQQAETANGFEDGDGCPDTVGAQLAQTAQRVLFDTGRATLRPDAVEVLGQLAAQLRSAATSVGAL